MRDVSEYVMSDLKRHAATLKERQELEEQRKSGQLYVKRAAERLLKQTNCVDGVISPTVPTDIHYDFDEGKSPFKANKLYNAFASDLSALARSINVRNGQHYGRNFNAFNPEHLDLSVSL